jgi:AraC family transcriptional regulator
MRKGIAVHHTSLVRSTVNDYCYAAGVRVPPHRHQQAALCIVLGGNYIEESDAGELNLHPGEAFFRTREREHANRAAGAALTRALSIELPDEVAAVVRDRCRADVFAFSRCVPPAQLAQLSACLEAPDAPAQLSGEAAVYQILGELLREGGRAWPVFVRRAYRLIRHGDPLLLDAARICDEVRVTAARLRLNFRRHVGMTVQQAIRERRLEVATGLLRDSDLPITDVAIAAGFYDQSHFTNAFREATGMSPGRFRAQAGR